VIWLIYRVPWRGCAFLFVTTIKRMKAESARPGRTSCGGARFAEPLIGMMISVSAT
jgi:hypothetical protein